jgi:transglutaminase-like putative cysteine protease
MTRRHWVAATVLAVWAGGLALLLHREFLRPDVDRLAEAGIRVSPGEAYFGVMQGERQIGFASSIIDTTPTSIISTDYFVADIPVGGRRQRATAQSRVTLSRGLRLKAFEVRVTAEGAPLRTSGIVDGDSVLRVTVVSGDDPPDSQRVSLTGPILLPTLVPLAVALTDEPDVGRSYRLPVFDPIGLEVRDVRVAVRAESTFVVSDSAIFDAASGRWRGALPATVRSWRVAAQGDDGEPDGLSAWIDEQGRILHTHYLGFELRRMPYEEAFVNWRRAAGTDSASAAPVDTTEDILETTAIGAQRLREVRDIAQMRVRLSGASLRGFDLNGFRQQLEGDTLSIRREQPSMLDARYTLPYQPGRTSRGLIDPEPLIQSDAPEIVALAQRIKGNETRPRVVAERINRWVHDSLEKEIRFGIPSALEVLRSRRGDCNEHTQLFIALARAAGIPARAAAGLAYINGKFYYHAWPEIILRSWVAVDPTFGQFPADAAHLRFIVGGLSRQAELLRLMGALQIDVLTTQP